MTRGLGWSLRCVCEKTLERVGGFSVDGAGCGSNADGNEVDGQENVWGSRFLLELPPLALWRRFKWGDW